MPTIVAPTVVVPYIQSQCIVQHGIKYCEQTNFTNHGIGILFFCIVLLILWSKVS